MRNSIVVSIVLAGQVLAGSQAAKAQDTDETEGIAELTTDLYAYERLPPIRQPAGTRANPFLLKVDPELYVDNGSSNQGIGQVSLPGDVSLPSGPAAPGAAWLPVARLWEAGSTLRVCFFNGPLAAQSFVAKIGKEWNDVGANVKIDFGTIENPRRCGAFTDAQIRVAFNADGGNWSYIGRSSLVEAPGFNQQTMELNINQVYSPAGRGTVLHEFGHALGLNHEHQRPYPQGCEGEINWPLALQYFSATQGWPSKQTLSQLAPRDTGMSAVITNDFDVNSIMMYPLPPFILLNGAESRCFVKSRSDNLSSGDRQALIYAYSDEVSSERASALRGYASSALKKGAEKEASKIALFALPVSKLNEIVFAYEQEGALGFQPETGKSSNERLDQALGGYLANLVEE